MMPKKEIFFVERTCLNGYLIIYSIICSHEALILSYYHCDEWREYSNVINVVTDDAFISIFPKNIYLASPQYHVLKY